MGEGERYSGEFILHYPRDNEVIVPSRCTDEEATQFLLELEATGIVQRVGDEW